MATSTGRLLWSTPNSLYTQHCLQPVHTALLTTCTHSTNHFKLHLPVVVANTVVDVGAVMVKLFNAAVTEATVFCTQRLDGSACVAQLFERVVALLPLVKVGHLHHKDIRVTFFYPLIKVGHLHHRDIRVRFFYPLIKVGHLHHRDIRVKLFYPQAFTSN